MSRGVVPLEHPVASCFQSLLGIAKEAEGKVDKERLLLHPKAMLPETTKDLTTREPPPSPFSQTSVRDPEHIHL